MRDPCLSRPLQLESLESRCLLAAGFFSVSPNEYNGSHRDRDSDRQGRFDSGAFSEVGSFRSESFDHHARDKRRHDGNNRSFQRDVNLPFVQAIQPSAQSTIVSAQRIVVLQPIESVATATRFAEVRTNRIDDTQLDTRNESSNDSALRLVVSRVPLPSTSAIEGNTDLTVQQSRADSIHAGVSDVSFRHQRSDSDKGVNDTTESVANGFEVPRSIVFSEYAFKATSRRGLFDSPPPQQGKPLEVHESESEDTWQINGDTIRKLKDVLDIPVQTKILPIDGHAVDEAIVEWFSETTGLIDICGVRTPLFHDSVPDSFVEVGLEATLSLHRSLELLATVDAKPLSYDLRSAILAVIVAKQSESVSPVQSPMSNASSVAYSGAALFAGALFVVGRRKRDVALETKSETK
jgi:hypothetical protein